MSTSLPEPLADLVQQISRLPGLGTKSALRIALTLLHWPEAETRQLGDSIYKLRDTLCLCSRCGAISAKDPCEICANPNRIKNILCIVPEWDAVLALEAGGFYQGLYFILGGLLAPLQNMDSSSLEINKLISRLRENEINEIIFALGSTLEAENTVSWLTSIIRREKPDIKISRLAQGIPLGSHVKFMDKETLRQAMSFRQNI